jgi:SPP1 gp7 family putative phage head morphogenesis protein
MLKPVRPAAPIRAKYDERLTALINEMHASIVHWISAEWRKNTPETVLMGADETPARSLQIAMSRLGRRWLRRFDQLADSLAEYFAKATRDRCDRSLMADLRKAGFTVRFKMTPAMRDAFDAVRAENVGLIKSIAQQHLAHVETLVMQSVSQGRDLATLTKTLTKTAGVTKRRASFIARDQNNKATAVMARARHLELGITQAKWLHSAGGNHPRPEHVAFSGKVYDIREGHDFGDGLGPVWPGTAINCRCVPIPIVPGFG